MRAPSPGSTLAEPRPPEGLRVRLAAAGRGDPQRGAPAVLQLERPEALPAAVTVQGREMAAQGGGAAAGPGGAAAGRMISPAAGRDRLG